MVDSLVERLGKTSYEQKARVVDLIEKSIGAFDSNAYVTTIIYRLADYKGQIVDTENRYLHAVCRKNVLERELAKYYPNWKTDIFFEWDLFCAVKESGNKELTTRVSQGDKTETVFSRSDYRIPNISIFSSELESLIHDKVDLRGDERWFNCKVSNDKVIVQIQGIQKEVFTFNIRTMLGSVKVTDQDGSKISIGKDFSKSYQGIKKDWNLENLGYVSFDRVNFGNGNYIPNVVCCK